MLGGPVIWAALAGPFSAVAFGGRRGGRRRAIRRDADDHRSGGQFHRPGGPMNVYLGGLLFGVFFFALGLALALRNPGWDPGRIPVGAGGAGVGPDRFAST